MLSFRYSNSSFNSSPQLLHPTTSNLWWQDPQNEVPSDNLPSEITPFRRKDTMTLAALGHIPGPLIEEHSLSYRYYQDEEVIKYPRMDSSPVSRPIYSQHSLDPHSPKPRIAAGTQLMFQNIIGYSEPVSPACSSTYSTHETGYSGLSDSNININGPRVSEDAHIYGVRHSGQSQGVCGYCEDPACKYADTYICAMADTQRRSAQGQELYDALDGMWRDMRAQRTNKASKPWCPRFS